MRPATQQPSDSKIPQRLRRIRRVRDRFSLCTSILTIACLSCLTVSLCLAKPAKSSGWVNQCESLKAGFMAKPERIVVAKDLIQTLTSVKYEVPDQLYSMYSWGEISMAFVFPATIVSVGQRQKSKTQMDTISLRLVYKNKGMTIYFMYRPNDPVRMTWRPDPNSKIHNSKTFTQVEEYYRKTHNREMRLFDMDEIAYRITPKDVRCKQDKPALAKLKLMALAYKDEFTHLKAKMIMRQKLFYFKFGKLPVLIGRSSLVTTSRGRQTYVYSVYIPAKNPDSNEHPMLVIMAPPEFDDEIMATLAGLSVYGHTSMDELKKYLKATERNAANQSKR